MKADRKILFIGVGGAGMAPLAMWCSDNGISVYGYDDYFKQSVLNYLNESKVNLLDSALISDIKSYDQIIYSSAIKKDHRLLKEAERLKIPCLKRGEFLAEIAKSKKLIAIVGSHGKTSCSALIAHIFKKLKFSINFIIGGFYNDKSLPYYSCGSEWLLAEIDESDGTINGFNPEITVLLNLDWDHTDHYKDFGIMKDVFRDLLDRTGSKIIMESKYLKELNISKFSMNKCVFIDQNLEFSSKITPSINKGLFDSKFNHYNKVFAKSVLKIIANDFCIKGNIFEEFPGVDRRQNFLVSNEEIKVIEDYAHHPREIDILLKSINDEFPNSELTVVFQPHRHTRTKSLIQDFVLSLSKANNVFILPVYSAFESECSGGMSGDLISAFKRKVYSLSFDQNGLKELLTHCYNSQNTKNNILLFIGAGSINDFAHAFCSLYEKPCSRQAWLNYTGKKVSPDCVLKLSENLASKTTFKIGGAAEYYVEPTSVSDVLTIIQCSRLFGLSYYCIGRGSNILVSDSGYAGIVIRFNHKNWQKIRIIDNNHIWVGCGVRLKELCGKVAQLGISGFEFLEGIPGTLGGALRMNAGAMGRWIFDIVDRVLLVDSSSTVKELEREAFTIEYRKVREISEGIAIGAVLKLGEVQAVDAIKERMDSYSDVRKGSQPVAPSAGCIFKNPHNDYAGRLIDELGLKNLSIGGAEVSGKHGNFIINQGGSTSKDVQCLIALIQKRVKEERGIDLEPEVLFLGNQNSNFAIDEEAPNVEA